MKKIVLAISGVVVLDLAFIFMMTGSDPRQLSAVPAGPAVAPLERSVAVQEQVALPPNESARTGITFDKGQVGRVNSGTNRASATSVPQRATPLAERSYAAQRPSESGTPVFKNTVIWYDRSGAEDDFHAQTLTASTVKTPDIHQKRKRSPLSKAFAVTKKPFKWAKSLIAKL
jgi:hypothetical protein